MGEIPSGVYRYVFISHIDCQTFDYIHQDTILISGNEYTVNITL